MAVGGYGNVVKQSDNDTTPLVNNEVTVADTEKSFSLPANCKGFILRSRNKKIIRLAFVSGETATNYFTLEKNAVYTDDNFYLARTIYFRTVGAADIVEIITFT